jgi:hypothetical protein
MIQQNFQSPEFSLLPKAKNIVCLVDNSSIERSADLFFKIHSKLNFTLLNNSNFLLGTDLLRANIRRDLLRTVILTTEEKFLEVGQKYKSSSAYKINSKQIFFDLVKSSTENFILKYYGSQLNLNPSVFENLDYIQTISADSEILVSVTFLSLFNKQSQVFQSTFVPIYSFATDQILERLLDNLIIEISNCSMRVIINEFSLILDVRQKWYKANFLSLRSLERFKNNLAWQDRLYLYINRPKSLYNSEYKIWIIRSGAVYSRTIYANRLNEILALNGRSLLIVNYFELQDFLASRLNEIIFFISKGTKYFLTSIIGQTIGLIWRGIIESLKK